MHAYVQSKYIPQTVAIIYSQLVLLCKHDLFTVCFVSYLHSPTLLFLPTTTTTSPLLLSPSHTELFPLSTPPSRAV